MREAKETADRPAAYSDAVFAVIVTTGARQSVRFDRSMTTSRAARATDRDVARLGQLQDALAIASGSGTTAVFLEGTIVA